MQMKLKTLISIVNNIKYHIVTDLLVISYFVLHSIFITAKFFLSLSMQYIFNASNSCRERKIFNR